MAFTLTISNNIETADFLSSTYKVEDGGFDISLPRVKQELVEYRPGFYVPLFSDFEYREAVLQFSIYGATRSAILSSIHKIERIIRSIQARQRLVAGKRGQLSYKWDGATNTTYFEIYSGEFSFPGDVLSVDKMFRQSGSNYYLPECTLKLTLSPLGFGTSIYSDTLTEVPLYNPSVGAKQTGGVRVQNPGTGQYHWVEIDGDDLQGGYPYLTRIQLASDTPFTSWNMLYMGLQVTPFPTTLILDSADLDYEVGSEIVSASAEGGSYHERVYADAGRANFADYAWSVGNNSVGQFFAFWHGFNALPGGVQYALGIDDYVTFGIRYQGPYVSPHNGTTRGVPLGVIQIPPSAIELKDYGTIDPDLWAGVWISREGAATLTCDYVSLLPISAGLRMLKARTSALTGTAYDDAWRGLEYLKDGSNNVSTPFYGLLDPLKLEPGLDQRIYFITIGSDTVTNERQRAMVVRVYAVPTYASLAL